uniref:Uncharacterized protein n=1 Tax=Oryza glumipatula TaxID=40148 RepID=A0A0E0A8A5_9ORYZ
MRRSGSRLCWHYLGHQQCIRAGVLFTILPTASLFLSLNFLLPVQNTNQSGGNSGDARGRKHQS